MADWLEDRTSKSKAYWVGRVQSLVQEWSTSDEDHPGHGVTDTRSVLIALLDEVLELAPEASPMTGIPPYDENMRAFALLGVICALWYGRLHRAKLYDPNRPLGNALPIYLKNYLPWAHALAEVLFDESLDSTFFPGQKWQYPFAPEAKGGSFV